MNVEYYLCCGKQHVNNQHNKHCKCNVPSSALKISCWQPLFVKVGNHYIFHREMIVFCFFNLNLP